MPGRILRLYRDAFGGLPPEVWRVALALLVNRAGTMVLPFLGLYLVGPLGLTTGRAGALLAVWGVGSIVGSWAGGALCARLGPLKVQELSLILGGLGLLVLPLARSLAFLVPLLFAVSAVSDAFRPASMTSAIELAPAEMRTRSLALVRMAANFGMAIGPAVGGVLAAIDYRWLFVVDGATCFLAAAVLIRSIPAQRRAVPAAVREAHGLAAHRDVAFVAYLGVVFVTALVFFQIFSTLPVYLAKERGFDEPRIGLVFAVNAALVVALEMVVVRALERRDPAPIVATGCVLLCAGFALTGVAPSFPAVLATVVVWTVGEMLLLPFSNGLVAQRAPAGRGGEYMGWFTATYSLAFIVAPPLGFAAYGRFGGRALWLGVAALAIPTAFAARRAATRLRAPV